MIGSAFSPWYHWAGRRDPENHCTVNVVTYGPRARFCMTERGRGALERDRDHLRIGRTTYRWEDGAMVIDLDERGAPPAFGRVRGRVTVTPSAITGVEVPLSDDGAHVWRPFGPTSRARVELEGETPYEAHAYLDGNFGTRPMEADFPYWTWARYPDGDGTVVFYDADRHDGTRREVAIRFGADGTAEHVEAPPRAALPRSGWRVRGETRADAGTQPRRVRSLLDAPFYCRSEVETTVHGSTVRGVHEAIDLRRLDTLLVRGMVIWRNPRRFGWMR